VVIDAPADVDERRRSEVEDDRADRLEDARTVRRVIWFAGALVAILLAHAFVVEPVRVRSDSMRPNLPPGSVVLIDKVTFLARAPRRGEVVMLREPRTNQEIVKRVIAIAGDSVGIDNGVVVVNGAPLVESYIDNDAMGGFYFGPDIVPAGRVFVLGDNRSDSIDSRTFGAVRVDDVIGRVAARLWG
jgi:signal peptidase I